ncbi:MAG: hypothetical protein ACRDRM_03460 [Pseudonocardiaceae bacterium]
MLLLYDLMSSAHVPWLRLRGVYTFAAAGTDGPGPVQLTSEAFVADPARRTKQLSRRWS